MCYVFFLTALFSFMWCDKWVLHRQKHTHKKQRPESEFDYSTIINSLFPEPTALDLHFILQTTSSTPAFLHHCPMGTSVPDSLYILFKPLLVRIENRKWENVSSWTSDSQSVTSEPAAAAALRSLLEMQIPHLRPNESETLGMEPTIFTNYFN